MNRKQLRIYSIAFHPNSENEFISGGWNRQIQFYDARVPNLLVATVPSPQICGEGLSFHPQGNEFCVAAWDKNQGVRIFDYAMKRPLEPSTQNTDYMKGVGGRQSEKTRISSSFLYSIQYFMGDYIATCGAYPSTVSVINRKTLRNVRNHTFCSTMFNKEHVYYFFTWLTFFFVMFVDGSFHTPPP